MATGRGSPLREDSAQPPPVLELGTQQMSTLHRGRLAGAERGPEDVRKSAVGVAGGPVRGCAPLPSTPLPTAGTARATGAGGWHVQTAPGARVCQSTGGYDEGGGMRLGIPVTAGSQPPRPLLGGRHESHSGGRRARGHPQAMLQKRCRPSPFPRLVRKTRRGFLSTPQLAGRPVGGTGTQQR